MKIKDKISSSGSLAQTKASPKKAKFSSLSQSCYHGDLEMSIIWGSWSPRLASSLLSGDLWTPSLIKL